jgi:hypothetical protein
MVRIRNEEEFLYPAVRSILDLVEEVVLVDNLSTDRSPEIMESLRAEAPDKVGCHRYPHRVARVGAETWKLASDPAAADSPWLSGNYYNWCMTRCREAFVLKWDADMVATPAFAGALENWRRSDRPILAFNGANVHADFRHLVAAKCGDREALLARLSVPGLPRWVTTLTQDFLEPRLFPRDGACYEHGLLWTQRLMSPLCEPGVRRSAWLEVDEPAYLHLKFCKKDPYSNYSSDLAAVIAGNVTTGPALDPEALALLRRLRIVECTA